MGCSVSLDRYKDPKVSRADGRVTVATKIEDTVVARFGTKMSLWHVRYGAKKVWRAIGVALNQIATEETAAQQTFGVVGFGHQPNRPYAP